MTHKCGGERRDVPQDTLAGDTGELYIRPCQCMDSDCQSVQIVLRNPEKGVVTTGPGKGETIYSLAVPHELVESVIHRFAEVAGLTVDVGEED